MVASVAWSGKFRLKNVLSMITFRDEFQAAICRCWLPGALNAPSRAASSSKAACRNAFICIAGIHCLENSRAAQYQLISVSLIFSRRHQYTRKMPMPPGPGEIQNGLDDYLIFSTHLKMIILSYHHYQSILLAVDTLHTYCLFKNWPLPLILLGASRRCHFLVKNMQKCMYVILWLHHVSFSVKEPLSFSILFLNFYHFR